MLKKLDLYMQAGVQEYWIVDAEKKDVLIYNFHKKDIIDSRIHIGNMVVKSKVFEGLEIIIPDIFTFKDN